MHGRGIDGRLMLQVLSAQELVRENWQAASLRALSADVRLSVREAQIFRGASPVALRALHLQNFEGSRGQIDAMALRIRYSDEAVHQRLQPDDEVGALVFEMLEQMRVESLCPDSWPGARRNIQGCFQAWLNQFHESGLIEGHVGLLLLSVLASSWSRLSGQPLPEKMQDSLEATRAGLAEVLGPSLIGMRRARNDQQTFAIHALAVAQAVTGLVGKASAQHNSNRFGRGVAYPGRFALTWHPSPPLINDVEQAGHGVAERGADAHAHMGLRTHYRIFNAAYDQEIEASTRVRQAQLREFRAQMDAQLSEWHIPWARMGRLYQSVLAHRVVDGWEGAQEEGWIDGRRLAHLIAAPAQRDVFRQSTWRPQSQVEITFLLDCSGSMKDQRFRVAAWVDAMVRVLEMAGVRSEVLGYTTGAWQGGRPYQEWLRRGRPAHPGRLNEVTHWVFKDIQSSWRKSRLGIAALLKADLYRESVDGEALLWAIQRRQKASPLRKVILMSDGCPMDSATQQANDTEGEDYLMRHFQAVLRWSEEQPGTQVWGCGVGQDMRTRFQHRLPWPSDAELAVALMSQWAYAFKEARG